MPTVIIIVLAITAVIVALITAANLYINKRGKKQGLGLTLGIDWGYLHEKKWYRLERLKRVKQEIKFGSQRFIRGYDNYLFKNFYCYMDLLIMEDLRFMLNHRAGTEPLDADGNPQKRGSGQSLSEEEYKELHERFNVILKKMLHHFEQASNGGLSEREQDEHRQQAVEMFAKYYTCLWD